MIHIYIINSSFANPTRRGRGGGAGERGGRTQIGGERGRGRGGEDESGEEQKMRTKMVGREGEGSGGGTTYTRGPEGIYIYIHAHNLRRVVCYTPSPHHTPSRRATAGGREDQQTRMALWGYPAPLCPSRGGWPPSAKHGPNRENHQA